MSDSEAVGTFPRVDQRAAFCHAQYDRVSKGEDVALELDLDEEGEEAFLRLAKNLSPLAESLEKTAHCLAVLAEDLVVVSDDQVEVVKASIGIVTEDLVTIRSQISDTEVVAKITKAIDFLEVDLAVPQLKGDLTTQDLATQGGLRPPASSGNLTPRFKVEREGPEGDTYRVRDTLTGRVVKSGLTRDEADSLAHEKNVAIRKAVGEKIGIFLRLPDDLAETLPSISDRDPSPRHATLLIVGECDHDQLKGVIKACQEVAKTLESFDVELTDFGEFKNAKNETIAHLIPRADADTSFEEIHRALRDAVVKEGMEPAHYSGPFKPHVTIAYLPEGESFGGERPEGKFKAEAFEVWGEAEGEVGKIRIAFGSGDIEQLEKRELEKAYVTVLKAEEEEENTVFGIVLEPETVDSQGDIYSAEEIRKTAYRFMERYQQFGLQHEELVSMILPLESYIAPVDFEVNGQNVKKGTWLLRVRVLDEDIWSRVKSGELTGFSIGGSAMRTPELVAA